MGSGAPPFANGREAPQARNRSGDTPSSFKQFYAIKIIYNFTKDYTTLKLPGLGRNPFRPLERSHVQSVSRYGRPEPYKQTLHNRSGCPFLVKGTTRPRPRNDGGTPELPRYQYKQIFRNIFHSRRNTSRHSKGTNIFRNPAQVNTRDYLGSGNPPPEPRSRATPSP